MAASDNESLSGFQDRRVQHSLVKTRTLPQIILSDIVLHFHVELTIIHGLCPGIQPNGTLSALFNTTCSTFTSCNSMSGSSINTL